ncbi:MAG TPA: hypothetical protein VK457_24995 [Chloroflexota bacterium]|nr:hypothetical protein [Chloroflexota bacterium]
MPIDPNPLDEIHEDIETPEVIEPARDVRGPARSGLTRWVAERSMKNQPASGTPTYERCQEKDCWGKATWTCPSCHHKSCSAHRPEHRCSLPYLPR